MECTMGSGPSLSPGMSGREGIFPLQPPNVTAFVARTGRM